MIRQGLLAENKFSKYLIYALGEIVLVVVGILVALQINNWNNVRINKQNEIKVYQNIKHQIVDDLKEIKNVKNLNSYHSSQFEYANQIITSKNRNEIDTLALITMNLSQYWRYNHNDIVDE